jgi:hypothetical protein
MQTREKKHLALLISAPVFASHMALHPFEKFSLQNESVSNLMAHDRQPTVQRTGFLCIFSR